jgi:hypothetical protein
MGFRGRATMPAGKDFRHYGPEGLINQFAFPIIYRVEDVPEDEGTLMLMVATKRSREWQSFWVPLETKLSHCCSLNTVA